MTLRKISILALLSFLTWSNCVAGILAALPRQPGQTSTSAADFNRRVHSSAFRRATAAVNPSLEDVAAYSDELALKYGVPLLILKAVAFQASSCRQFGADGKALVGPNYTIGIMRVPVEDVEAASCLMKLGRIVDAGSGGAPSVASETVVVNINELKLDWRYNFEVGARRLVLALGDLSAATGLTSYERWSLALARYAGNEGGDETTQSRIVTNNNDWRDDRVFPYAECIINIANGSYRVPRDFQRYFGAAVVESPDYLVSATTSGVSPVRAVPGGQGGYGFNQLVGGKRHTGIDYTSALSATVVSVGTGVIHSYTKTNAGSFGSINPNGNGPAIWVRYTLLTGAPIYILYGHTADSWSDTSYTDSHGNFHFSCSYQINWRSGDTVAVNTPIGKTAVFYNGGDPEPHLHLGCFLPKQAPNGSYYGPPSNGWGYGPINLTTGDWIDPEEFYSRSEYLLSDSGSSVNGSFNTSVSPTSRTVTQGGTTSYNLTVASVNGFSGTVNLSAINLPSGYVPSGTYWSPSASVSVPANGSVTATLYIGTNTSTSTGSFTTMLRATSGSIAKDVNVTTTINGGASFNTSVSPTSRTVTRGGTTSYNLTVASVNGFSGTVNLAAINLPSGYVPSGTYWSPSASVSVPANGSVTATLYIGTNTSTSTGSFTTTLRATSGSIAKEVNVTTTINP
jgi:hypothetical protein